jgi:hypothetical protein
MYGQIPEVNRFPQTWIYLKVFPSQINRAYLTAQINLNFFTSVLFSDTVNSSQCQIIMSLMNDNWKEYGKKWL